MSIGYQDSSQRQIRKALVHSTLQTSSYVMFATCGQSHMAKLRFEGWRNRLQVLIGQEVTSFTKE
jgi:hypothetical protein